MRIEFDYSFDTSGNVSAKHFVETTPGDQDKATHPMLGPDPVDFIHLAAAWVSGKIPVAGTGWDMQSSHPSHPGKTRLEVFVAEVIRLNDTEARKILGV
jgi:hypothetical protein